MLEITTLLNIVEKLRIIANVFKMFFLCIAVINVKNKWWINLTERCCSIVHMKTLGVIDVTFFI